MRLRPLEQLSGSQEKFIFPCIALSLEAYLSLVNTIVSPRLQSLSRRPAPHFANKAALVGRYYPEYGFNHRIPPHKVIRDFYEKIIIPSSVACAPC